MSKNKNFIFYLFKFSQIYCKFKFFKKKIYKVKSLLFFEDRFFCESRLTFGLKLNALMLSEFFYYQRGIS